MGVEFQIIIGLNKFTGLMYFPTTKITYMKTQQWNVKELVPRHNSVYTIANTQVHSPKKSIKIGMNNFNKCKEAAIESSLQVTNTGFLSH